MVIILLGEGFEETEALTPANLLRRAGIEVSLVGLTGRQVTGGHGIIVQADQTLEELDQNLDLNQVEMLVLPGGGQGTASIQRNERALGLIQQCWDHGCFLGAICAAPTILGAMGILDRQGSMLSRHGGPAGLRCVHRRTAHRGGRASGHRPGRGRGV